MPDPSPPKRRPLTAGCRRSAAAATGFAELHCCTNFSFLQGASHPDELVSRAAELQLQGLAITDRNSLAGVVRAHVAARDCGLPLLIGAEITLQDAHDVVLWASDRDAYGRLSQLITRGRRRGLKGECHLAFEDLARDSAGLLAGVIPTERLDRCRKLPPPSTLAAYRDVFNDRCYLLAELHCGPDDERYLQMLQELSRAVRIPLVAANDVQMHVRERKPLLEILAAIRAQCRVSELGTARFPNAERSLQSPDTMRQRFDSCPDAVRRTLEIRDRCEFSLAELRYEYPAEQCPAGMSATEYLSRLTWQGAHQIYGSRIPASVRQLIEYELRLIEELHYEPYFLTVWDLVRFARSRGILCQGRGSAANSAVCFCLGVTSVDPERIDVLFERFVSKERDEAPDIDVDFEHERREEVIQYVYEKYGRERAGMTAEVITYRLRSAVRDVGKALGLSLDRVDVLAKSVEHYSRPEQLAHRFREAGFDVESRTGQALIQHATELLGFPRHLSQHVGGLVITSGPLSALVPIENAAMGLRRTGGEVPQQPLDAPRTVIQWDKDDLDELGILKVDCLALGMLTAIHKCFRLIERHDRRHLTLATIPAEDPCVYEMIQQADTLGVFQIESRAQMSMLPRLRPRCFYDLVIEVAIVRPGPIQGDMVHPYLKRRRGTEPVTYPDQRIQAVLEKTLGVPIFQEQAMRLAVVAAGFTPGEADQLRRAMGAWRRTGVMERFREKMICGMCERGYTVEFAERLFRQIRGFGEYGFPESHAASFALLVYVSCWLKYYYPAAFTTALLNSQPMGFYAPAQLIADARRHGVEVRGIDVNFSQWDSLLEPLEGDATGWAIRLGFRLVRGLRRADIEHLCAVRERGPFVSFTDLVRRTSASQSLLFQLARAAAFESLQLKRRSATWEALVDWSSDPLWRHVPHGSLDATEQVELPEMSEFGEVVADYRSFGLSLRAHPFVSLRALLRARRVDRAAVLNQVPHGRRVQVAGLVLLRQRPSSASGVTFVTLEDETGFANLIIHTNVWERFSRIAGTARALLARGVLQREDEIVHVVVDQLEDLSEQLAELVSRSRDFR